MGTESQQKAMFDDGGLGDATRSSRVPLTQTLFADILLPSTSSIRQSAYAHSATATQLLSAVRYHPRFQTGSSRIDGLLDGGLARGQMVEIASPPSGGKTRLAVGTAVGAVLLAMTTAKAEEVHALFIGVMKRPFEPMHLD